MSVALGVPHGDYSYRPTLQRSRSHSTPTDKAKLGSDNEAPPLLQRPSHGRSQSYLSPTIPKPQKASTDPVEERGAAKSHRIHIPGKHHLYRDEHRKHRYTQSEVEQRRGLRRQHGDKDTLPYLIAGLKREGEKKGSLDHEMLSAVPGSLTRMMSTRSHRGHTNADGLNEIASSRYGADPRLAQNASIKKNPIEEELDRADRIKRQRKFTVSASDIARRDTEIASAEEELRQRLEDVNSKGTSMTRRLDYGYYNLLEKVGNLISTIQSFQSLAEQSRQLISNFEHETTRVEGDMARRIQAFKHTFEEREGRVDAFEVKGKLLNRKAEDLGRRLEVARSTVVTWEKEESKARKVWGRVWGGMWWTLVSVVLVILTVVCLKEWWFRGDPVRAALRIPPGGSHNASLSLGEGSPGEARLTKADIPEDVKSVLRSIEERSRERKDLFIRPVPVIDGEEVGPTDDGEFRILDEL